MSLAQSLSGQKFALTTMHGKEQAIARPFEQILSAELVLPVGIDTDQLGSFTGEKPRIYPPLETAMRKARLGLSRSGLRYGLASEASFGPHPHLPWLPVQHEYLVWLDQEKNQMVCESVVTSNTNYSSIAARSLTADVLSFLQRVRFPSHALIVRSQQPGLHPVRKGITDPHLLETAIYAAARASGDGMAVIETDMRAHFNPRRMAIIRRLARKLAWRLAQPCPACDSPGFGPLAIEPGLPCAACNTPTILSSAVVHGCGGCGFQQHHSPAHGLHMADPGYCQVCNP